MKIDYQDKAVEELKDATLSLLRKGGTRICIFKAPTGSGKTIMVAQLLRTLTEMELPGRYAYLWISSNKLHVQSMDKVSTYLSDSRYSFLLLDEIAGSSFEENQVLFVNWESLIKQDKKTGEFKAVLMRESETGRNLPTFVTNSKDAGLGIILIVDESHSHYWSQKSQELVQDIIAPNLILEVSATPVMEPTAEDLFQHEAGFVSIKFEDVVEEGMIKSSTVINEAMSGMSDFTNTADSVIIRAALAKRDALVTEYSENNSEVNPLVLIQLPSESQSLSALDVSKLEEVERILSDKHDITVENGKLAVWLSDRKDNVGHLSENTSPVEVLIFKQAIALGWDCPRAQILIMFRDIKLERFEIQTVGRILRMPELKHYGNDALDQAYIYTNLDRISIADDNVSKGFFKIQRAVRKEIYNPINLPSIYLSRVDYGDLTLAFRKLFDEEANKYFKIRDNDMPSVAKDKVSSKLNLEPEEYRNIILSDAIIRNIDKAHGDILGRDKAEFAFSPDEVKRAFEAFAKFESNPFAPVRSHTKIQQAIYDWFDKRLGYEKHSRLDIQKIALCSEKSQLIFHEIIAGAKERFKEVDRIQKQSKQTKKEYVWNVPESDYFNENFEYVTAQKSILVSPGRKNKTLLLRDRRAPEKGFELFLESSDSVLWWYKNGDSGETYFAVAYIDPITGFERSFYPDYIVQFNDGKIGIYDTKAGMTKDLPETGSKSNALQVFITQGKGSRKGGIVTNRQSGWFVCDKVFYTVDDRTWTKVEL